MLKIHLFGCLKDNFGLLVHDADSGETVTIDTPDGAARTNQPMNSTPGKVSAMAGTTDQLAGWCREAALKHDAREYDAIVAAGEQVTAGLLAIVLQDMGIPARSWMGWQVAVRTDGVHGAARILEIDDQEIRKRLEQGQVAVMAGFQGIGPEAVVTLDNPDARAALTRSNWFVDTRPAGSSRPPARGR